MRLIPCVLRPIVDGSVELILRVHVHGIVVGGPQEACNYLYAGLVGEFPTNCLVYAYTHAYSYMHAYMLDISNPQLY